MAVIKDVAKLAGVSVGAVSKYLKDPGHMREDTRGRIEAAVRALNYHPSPLARSLRTRRTHTAAVMMPPVTNPFFAELFDGIRQRLKERGYAALLQTANDVDELRAALFSQSIGRMDGAILCFLDDERPVAELAGGKAGGKPLVAMSWHSVLQGCGAVTVDIRGGMRGAAGHLLGRGCRRVAYIGGPKDSGISGEKYAGYLSALAESGLRPDPAIVLRGGYTLEDGYRAAELLLRAAPLPDGVAAENDALAVGCIRRLLRQGVAVPGEVKVTGFDDIPLSLMVDPPVTTVRLPIKAMARAAADTLIRMLEGGAARENRFDTALVIRRSTDAGAPDGLPVSPAPEWET